MGMLLRIGLVTRTEQVAGLVPELVELLDVAGDGLHSATLRGEVHGVVVGNTCGGGFSAFTPGEAELAVVKQFDALYRCEQPHVACGLAVDVECEAVADGGAGACRAGPVAERAAERDPADRRARIVVVLDVLDPVVHVRLAVSCRHAARGCAGGILLARIGGQAGAIFPLGGGCWRGSGLAGWLLRGSLGDGLFLDLLLRHRFRPGAADGCGDRGRFAAGLRRSVRCRVFRGAARRNRERRRNCNEQLGRLVDSRHTSLG